MTSRPRLTVVIPTKNSAATIFQCLNSLRLQTQNNVEIIVVDNFSTDDTVHVSGHLGATVILAGPERSSQRNVGLRAANSQNVLFVDSDMTLEPNVCQEVVNLLDMPARLIAVTIPEMSFGNSTWARARSLERKLILGNSDVEAPRGFRCSELIEVGGWSENQVAGEDWELADRYRSRGASFHRTSAQIWHDEGRLSLRKSFSKKRYYARDVAKTLTTSSHRNSGLVTRFLGTHQASLISRQPFTSFRLLILKLTEFFGFAIGLRFPPSNSDGIYRDK